MEKIATTLPSYQLFVDCSHTQIVSSIQLSMAFIAVSFVPGRVCLRIPHVPSPRKDMLSCSRPWLILLLQEEVGMKWNQQTASLMKDLLPADTSVDIANNDTIDFKESYRTEGTRNSFKASIQ